MQITFHGAAQTVTGSQHLLTINGRRLLLDCGLYQGKRDEARERNRHLPFPVREVEATVLSHAHIDHSGNLPNLVKSGYDGPIYCTRATADLLGAMLLDSGRLQERDVEYVNKKRLQKGEPPVEPIYTEADASRALRQVVGLPYDRPHSILPGVTLTFLDAGHMLGSAIVVLEVEEGGRRRRLVFSGDLGRPGLPLLRDPAHPERADILLLEGTYGDRRHPPLEESAAALGEVIRATARRGGKVIIPAFAVERTQLLVLLLNRLYNQGDLPEIPVFVDSPLAVDVTQVFRSHPECFDEATLAELRHDPDRDVFGFRRLTYIREVENSKALNLLAGPCVIISASGMCEAGRIQHHLKNTVEDHRHTILIVGWQAPNTLGRRLVEKQPVVRIFGEEYRLRAQVVTLNGFSGHADREDLLGWVRAFQAPPEQVFLVHGEPEALSSLAGALNQELGLSRVQIPAPHQTVAC